MVCCKILDLIFKTMDEKAFESTLDNLWRARRILDLAKNDLLKEIKNTESKSERDLEAMQSLF